MSEEDSPPPTITSLNAAARKFSASRQKPLLIMYYPDGYGDIGEDDVRDLYDEFRDHNVSREHKLSDLDIIIHTYGGSPDAAYLLAQTVRSMTERLSILVPEYSFSAGTLFSMCGNEILFGDFAVLSPIDITLSGGEVDSDDGEEPEQVQLANIDNYLKFTRDCLDTVLEVLTKRGYESTNVESELLVEMVKQVTALNVGKFFRERQVTAYYAERLLLDYLLAERDDKVTLNKRIVKEIVYELPSHEFMMDYSICTEIGLPVKRMTVAESDASREIIRILKELMLNNVICPDTEGRLKLPHFQLYITRGRNR